MGEFVSGGVFHFQLPKRDKELDRITTKIHSIDMYYRDMASITGDCDRFQNVRGIGDGLTDQERKRLQFLIVKLKERVDGLHEILCGEEKSEAVDLPPHLRDNARHVTCSKCGRVSFDLTSIGKTCNMPQPDYERCDGVFK